MLLYSRRHPPLVKPALVIEPEQGLAMVVLTEQPEWAAIGACDSPQTLDPTPLYSEALGHSGWCADRRGAAVPGDPLHHATEGAPLGCGLVVIHERHTLPLQIDLGGGLLAEAMSACESGDCRITMTVTNTGEPRALEVGASHTAHTVAAVLSTGFDEQLSLVGESSTWKGTLLVPVSW